MNNKTKCETCNTVVPASWVWVGDDDRALVVLNHDVDGKVCAGSGQMF